jgi:hypothetical protein
MYVMAARSTSIMQIQWQDVFVDKHRGLARGEMETMLSVRFRAGKTIRTTGAYTLHTVMPTPLVEQLCMLQHDQGYLFGRDRRRIAQAVSLALRTHGADVRQCRRGCLRHLAAQGVAPEDLLLLSRHTTTEALYRYVGAGLHLRREAQTMIEMAKHLQFTE